MARRGTENLLAAKERKKKMIAIGGAVLLVGLLAIQLPRTMKMLDRPEGPSPAEAQAADEETQQPTSATPPAAPVPTDFAVVDRDLASSGQLVSFSRFSRKDPFSPQIRETTRVGGSSKRATSRPARNEKGKAQKPKAARGKAAKRPDKGGSAANGAAPAQTARPSSAVISVNGVRDEVQVGAAFPASEKVFRLVSIGDGSARIGIAGGSLVGGSQTVVLERGKTLTLMNTADGARYELRLVSFG
jgi:hypothetical protein